MADKLRKMAFLIVLILSSSKIAQLLSKRTGRKRKVTEKLGSGTQTSDFPFQQKKEA